MYWCNMDMHMKQPVNQGCYIGTGDADYIRSHVLSQARSTNYRAFSFCYICPVKIYEQQCTWALFNRDVTNVFYWKALFFSVILLWCLCFISGDDCPRIQSKDRCPFFCALLPVHNGFLRFTACATRVGYLATSMATGSFSHLLFQGEIGCWLCPLATGMLRGLYACF